jgi:amino acid transporter
MRSVADLSQLSADEQRLAELGYKQELSRTWSGFNNFAISFSIISVLAGCFTSFSFAWNNGGPLVIAWGWPIVAIFILLIGFCMSELVSAFPTSGGIYWWAAKLGNAKAAYYTGWLNLIGLLAVVASVAYGAAYFLDQTISNYNASFVGGYANGAYPTTRIFIEFTVILVVAALINIFSSHLLALVNSVSVWWHVAGATAIVLILFLIPKHHASASFVFGHAINNSGWFGGATSGASFFLIVLPFGFLLTQYTITGFDASAHLSEETNDASTGAAKGLYRSILYSGIAGWALELAFLFAVQDEKGVTTAGGWIGAIFSQALTPRMATLVLAIATAGQFFCTIACLTSCSRMMYAFSRDGAVPFSYLWSKLNHSKTPVNGVIGAAVVSFIITLPALIAVKAPAGYYVPQAFYALTSISVFGLFLAFAIPIYLRWRIGDGDRFKPGPWNLGNKYKWMAPLALIEIALTTIWFAMPFSPNQAPWDPTFNIKFLNYSPVLTLGALLALWIGWHLSAKKWFTGPKHTIDLPPEVTSAEEQALERGHEGYLTGQHGNPTADDN